jgi:RNA polymerase sigma-70 factor (ECF subfamily)
MTVARTDAPRTASAEHVDDPSLCPPSEVRAGLAVLRPELFARAVRLARSRAVADDLVQETMLRALRFERQFHGGTNLRAWVGQVLVSVFLTTCRRAKRERRALERLSFEPSALAPLDRRPMLGTLTPKAASALASLAPSYREAVTLVDLEQLSYRDAAVRAGVPIGTVMSRLHRARKQLAALLAEPSDGIASAA